MSVGILKNGKENKLAGNAKDSTAANTTYNNGTSELQANNVQSAIDELDSAIDTLNSNLGTICNNFKSYEELTKDTDISITKNGTITFTLYFGSSTYSGYTFMVNSIAMFADANLDVASQNRQVTRCFRVFAGDTIQLQVNSNTTLNRFRIYYTGKSE